MVGGFADCELIQHRMKEKFGKHKKIIIPAEAGLVVLKGAVLYGHQPKVISARFLRRTYGIQSLWGPHMQPESKKSYLVDVNRCKDLFFKYAKVGEQVVVDHEVSQTPDPRYVTDQSCQRLGNLIIPLPEVRAGQTLEIEETMIFGDTELIVRARDLHTGRVVETQFDLL
ncbi:unnamed protein product [Mytilus edulis]|uniref:Uncharacterized protein n=1 Tax=Mytilus edulis TaxID=6550 RepID=A0A8S3QM64_MYTED|nr:unnamed protein product [Mytilus edulis]